MTRTVWLVLLGAALLWMPGAASVPPSTLDPQSGQPADSAVAAARAGGPGVSPPRDYLADVRAGYTAENRSYAGIRTALGFTSPIYVILVGLLVLFSGLSARLRDIAHAMGHRRHARVLVYFALLNAVAFVLMLPLTWYQEFALDHRFGLSNQSLGGWLGEQALATMLAVIGFGVIPIASLLYFAIARSPRRWWLWVGLGALPLTIVLTLLQPLVVDPLFNRFQPLQDRRLEARILRLAEQAGVPARNVYEVNRSKQTKKLNAYVNGFGASQRIVIWDTTLEAMRDDEILSVVGHEIGHYRLGHIWKGILFYWAAGLIVLLLTARLAEWGLARFGERWDFQALDDVASMPLLWVALSVVVFFAQPGFQAFSREIEHQADGFGLEITRDNDAAARAFLKIGAQNRSDPEPPPLVRLFLYSHPPLAERIRFAVSYHPWAEGRPNRYFRREGTQAPVASGARSR